jgi:hypothetical protein
MQPRAIVSAANSRISRAGEATVENKPSQSKRGIYILLALMVILGLGGIWAARSYLDRAISTAEMPATPSPTATEQGSAQKEGATSTTSTLEGAQTPTPTKVETLVTIRVDQADVRAGPDPIFDLLIQVKRGLILKAVGRNEASTYLLVLLPDDRQGWIPIAATEYDFDLELLPIVDAPPTPTPTPTPTRTPVPAGSTPGAPGTQKTPGASPYGQGMLAPPELPGVGPAAAGSPLRRALGVFAAALIPLAMWWLSGSVKSSLVRLAQVLASLF